MRSEKLRRLINVLEEARGIMSDFPEIRLFETWRRDISGMLGTLYEAVEVKNEEKKLYQDEYRTNCSGNKRSDSINGCD